MAGALETTLVLATLGAACGLAARACGGGRAARRVPFVAVASLLGVFAASAAALRPLGVGVGGGVAAGAARAAPPAGLPRSDDRASPYVSSRACLGCHPGEHASFARTFHRTMTQVASPRTVLAPLGDATGLERRGDEVWVERPGEEPRRVVLTTGSHREQAFWVAGRRPGELVLLPFVWMVRERVVLPRRDAFLTPNDAPLTETHWSSNCIACHAVGGEPRHDPLRDAFDTRVGELGVACEACHGPAAAHAAKHRDPVERYMQHARNDADATIVQPARLSADRSAAVCGQCHAYAYPRDEDDWWTSGYTKSYRPGDPLERSRFLLGPDLLGKPDAPRIDAAVDSLFWSDGSIRVGGREYNGLVASPCFARGEGERKMTCLSCHAMHRGDPAGQIAPDRGGDRACTTCHGGEHASPAHTHHASASAGAACVSCHMPKTSYALLSAVRSHRIDSPSAAATLATGRPNACNLCHLDRSLAWTARALTAWYGAPEVIVPPGRADVAEGIHGALAGDAAVRVIVADALGSTDAIATTGDAWQAPILEVLARDPYAAVRFVADRSRRRVRPGGAPLDPDLVQTLLAARDPRAITIAE